MSRPLYVTLLTAALTMCGVFLSGCNESTPPSRERDLPAHRVLVTPVSIQQLGITQVRTGTLRARKHVRLHNQEAGRIVQLPVFEGDSVDKEQLLVQLDDRLLKAELAKARANLHQAEEDLARIERLSDKNLISQDEQVRAGTALEVAASEVLLLETRLSYTRILAPFAGIITERLAEPGDAVPAYEHILSLADPDSLITELRISELLHSQLQQGDRVQVSIDALGPEQFSGRISRIHPTIDPVTRQGIVEVLLNPVPAGARAGQLCRVSITSAPSAKQVIPLQALRRDSQGDYVFVIRDNQAQRQSIRTGATFDQAIEVLDGLEPGQQVVTKGFLGLTEGAQVQVLSQQDTDNG